MCKKCEKRDICVKLCKKAEEYCNQDFVPREEGLVPIHLENYDSYDKFGHYKGISPNFDNSSILKMIILKLHSDGKNTRKIAEQVPVSRRYIRQIIDKMGSK